MDRGCQAARLQGRLRDGGDGRLSVRLRRDHRGGARPHFDTVYQAYLMDEETLAFLRRRTPMRSGKWRRNSQEAIERGLWTPKSNSAKFALKEISEGGVRVG
jgi:cobalamin biosynthesis Mg chelatase CobN